MQPDAGGAPSADCSFPDVSCRRDARWMRKRFGGVKRAVWRDGYFTDGVNEEVTGTPRSLTIDTAGNHSKSVILVELYGSM